MATIRKIIDDTDQSQTVDDTLNEALNLLMELGQTHADKFADEIQLALRSAGKGNDMTIPVTAILDSSTEVRAITSITESNIGDAVNQIAKDFVSGGSDSVVNGISSIITTALNVLLGDGEASGSYIKKYYTLVEGEALIRIDMIAWKRDTKASSIRTRLSSVVAASFCKSSIDISKVNFNEFLDIYGPVLRASGATDDQVQAGLNNAGALYNKYKGNSASDGTTANTASATANMASTKNFRPL